MEGKWDGCREGGKERQRCGLNQRGGLDRQEFDILKTKTMAIVS